MALQRTFDELGTPLFGVTFCIVDLETTGGSAENSAITEIGAVKVRGGESLGTFHSLVNPGEPVPAFIRLLTGITNELVAEAPEINAVLPSFIEFCRGTVLVAHNARFDVSFLNAALERCSYPPLENRVVDTALLARKMLTGEVPNNKLETLARHLRCAHQPSHRAYADALATTDLLHHLIERGAGFGVTTLEDLLQISFTRMDQTISKVRLADDLPREAGVYRFLGGAGRTLYVGKATDLRARVRSYFYGDPRRRIRNLLRETQSIAAEVHPTLLEAEIAEARAIASELPPYNRAGKSRPSWYLKVALKAKTPRLSAARALKSDGVYIGPFKALKNVHMLMDALRDVRSLHRCTDPHVCKGCVFSELRTCSGTDRARHHEEVRAAIGSLTADPSGIFDALERRMRRLSAGRRFEEAAEIRERASFLERALVRSAEAQALAHAGAIVLMQRDRAFLIRSGRLAAACHAPSPSAALRLRSVPPSQPFSARGPDAMGLVEARVITRWLGRAEDVRILWVDGSLALPVWAKTSGRFTPREDAGSG